ncbi:hypothetical protein FS837_007444 [Tulasnella sp. UAMH 9824]|nr:hypothetical protein FS837_007444 [Tulasnella sp. UAMH 9824]
MASPIPSSMDSVSVVRSYFQAYAQLDYRLMAMHTTDEFVFEDPVFPHLEGDFARAMFKMFIQGAPKSGAKFTILDVSETTTDPNVVNAKYRAEYNFNGRPVTNEITSVLTVEDGKVCKQVDSFDFPGWAAQTGGFMGWLLGGTSFAQSATRDKAKNRLEAFMKKDPDLAKALEIRH